MATGGVEQACSVCAEILPSKTKLFRHLETSHGILGTSSVPLEKVVLLVGWVSPHGDDEEDIWQKDGTLNAKWIDDELESFVREALVSAIVVVDEGGVSSERTAKGLHNMKYR